MQTVNIKRFKICYHNHRQMSKYNQWLLQPVAQRCHSHIADRVQDQVKATWWEVLKHHAHRPILLPCHVQIFGLLKPSETVYKGKPACNSGDTLCLRHSAVLPTGTFEMRKCISTISLAKPRYKGEEILKIHKVFMETYMTLLTNFVTMCLNNNTLP